MRRVHSKKRNQSLKAQFETMKNVIRIRDVRIFIHFTNTTESNLCIRRTDTPEDNFYIRAKTLTKIRFFYTRVTKTPGKKLYSVHEHVGESKNFYIRRRNTPENKVLLYSGHKSSRQNIYIYIYIGARTRRGKQEFSYSAKDHSRK